MAARSTPTAPQLRVWRDFIETVATLQGELGRRLQDDSDLSAADYSVLLALSDQGDHELRSSELARTIGWERSRLSHHLGRMERRGLIRRDDCATDNRGAVVVLTEEGSGAFRRANVPHLRAIRELFIDRLDDEQLQMVDGITKALRTSA
ncbi:MULTISPECIES: MarR family transcriptional regulator [unclassified Microbacterium]|uniref:MarR family winged helix-turn-helix transcriptional regulator n=1 Tax=unclassified Microbacterium TaxID=2609290 RepID=UPI000D514963|nr:MarR family transcriptional regulator [Microbacterium sp. TPD7012]PVE98379.1 MarR family transcriptional regulator [Microbacterium sp. TPD7012]